MKWIIPITCFVSALGIFYGMFFRLAPYVCGLVPPSQWQSFLKVAVYFFVAYFGGIGLPFILIFFGVITLLRIKD
ncbi:MAG TPA: hypothetical protein DEE98_04285 [Elusimicrobia bacterium]|nr:MAG: hypothetical protein A2278_07300 [Elusimicrobia bacterium RIFOXYA12_FULL_49_49]OGS10124.1 MAG: hypothetical protein A2204_03155 [Elusimicrobia bacterium RIFOXYA1_FULL_47_7]OGS16161.1 MAG: hypothetical protein A2251_00885 [Elusimicrobia bacterium RIFOXYA2_FULL_47_53]OGS26640.1 MAG: hypothetical protein A2339_04475 [Elusimicrobia bacterium RIFOXYB12_FULL_50_12]OGS31315.1 MAG: hypothetical protein A2323_09175 [Elusimicrobia bacterium RIFOXYB2_FULL_46_23]HBU69584.1 hypothetical protein [El